MCLVTYVMFQIGNPRFCLADTIQETGPVTTDDSMQNSQSRQLNRMPCNKAFGQYIHINNVVFGSAHIYLLVGCL